MTTGRASTRRARLGSNLIATHSFDAAFALLLLRHPVSQLGFRSRLRLLF